MPSVPYSFMHMPIGWNGLSMPNKGCSVHMPIIITNFKLRGVEQDSVPYMMKIILIHIPFECEVVKNLHPFMDKATISDTAPTLTTSPS